MRDPARIDIMLKELERYWKKWPDLRLGQIMIVAHIKSEMPDLFYLEDDKLLDILRGLE